MGGGVFERVEKKYRIGSAQWRALEGVLRDHGYGVDCYGRSAITSMYWDTDDCRLICHSLEKPLYKEKVRIRSYSPDAFSSADEDVFVELKKKFDGVVYKRRVECSLDEACGMLSSGASRCVKTPALAALGAHARLSKQVPKAPGSTGVAAGSVQADSGSARVSAQSAVEAMNEAELACFVDRYPALSPSVTTRCVREAWALDPECEAVPCNQGVICACAHEPELRVTFDSQLSGRDERAGRGGDGRSCGWFPLIGEDESILEAKAAGAFPLWFAHALGTLDIRPCSFSKCGTAFSMLAEGGSDMLQEEWKEER